MKVTVTVEKPFVFDGKRYYIGDKLKVTEEKAKELAFHGFIKSMIVPVVDKMIREPKGRKGK